MQGARLPLSSWRMGPVFKIFRIGEWQDFAKAGVFAGAGNDRRDGFIHLSSAEQVAGTLARHFSGDTLVVLAEIDAEALGGALKREPSRNGELFPHLYAPLLARAVLRAARLTRAGAAFSLPDWFAS